MRCRAFLARAAAWSLALVWLAGPLVHAQSRATPLEQGAPMTHSAETVALPAPHTDGAFSIERALSERRSVREFAESALTLAEIAQILWAAQGVTDASGARTAPSAGALYPLEVYVVVGNVRQLVAGVYWYEPRQHRLARHAPEDRRIALAKAAYHQDWTAEGAVILAVTAVETRTTRKYGERGVRYVHMEAGHAAQNALLQAAALGLGGTVVGAFDDAEVAKVLGLRKGEQPLYLVPLGRPK
jgi:SagB-type dehydrogenase family enzyme